jgi:hypothetical protein
LGVEFTFGSRLVHAGALGWNHRSGRQVFARERTMAKKKRSYIAYLLRLWRERSAGVYIWRASLEDPHTGRRQGFADLDRLLNFLKEQTARGEQGDSSPPDPPSLLL